MGKIILVRHGQDEDNAKNLLNGRRDTPLTELGVIQAYELADKLKQANMEIKHIFSSNLRRAVSTAKICSEALGIPHSIMECLVERSHGILEGHHYSEIPSLAKSYKEIYGLMYVLEVEGGETYQELCERAKRVLIEIENKIEELEICGNVLVVSHGAISRAMTVVHRGLSHDDIFNEKSFLNCEFRILE